MTHGVPLTSRSARGPRAPPRPIRRRVVAATLAAFVLAWGVIAFHGTMGAGVGGDRVGPTADVVATATHRRRIVAASTDGTSGAASGLAPATTAQS